MDTVNSLFSNPTSVLQGELQQIPDTIAMVTIFDIEFQSKGWDVYKMSSSVIIMNLLISLIQDITNISHQLWDLF